MNGISVFEDMFSHSRKEFKVDSLIERAEEKSGKETVKQRYLLSYLFIFQVQS